MITQLVQVSFLFAVMTATYFGVASALHWPAYDRTARRRWIVGTLLAATCALLIGLPQMTLSWAYISLSNRSALALSASAQASLDWRALLTIVDPNALHALRGAYSGPADRVEAFLYLGVVPTLLLACLGSAWSQPSQRRQLVFFSTTAVIAWLYMLGVNGFFYGWLFAWLPGLTHFRRPSDAAFLLNFSFAIITGLAASHLRLDSRRQLSLLLALATIWLVLSSLHMRRDWTDWQAETLMGAALAGVALHRLQRPGSRRRAAGWILMVLVVDYRCYNLNGTFNQGPDTAALFKRDAVVNRLLELQRASPGLPPRVEPDDAGASWDNQVVLPGIASTQGYDPVRYGLYDQWYGAREISTRPRANRPFDPAADSKLTDLLAVGYLVHGVQMDGRPWSAPGGYQKIFSTISTELWQNAYAYPRLLTPVTALTKTANGSPTPAAFAVTDFRERVWLTPRDEDDRRTGESVAAACSGRLHIEGAHSEPSKIVIRTASNAAGWLVLSELDFPGWAADADASPLPIHRANGMFRAVCVPAGDHAVSFVFHPWTMVAEVWKQRAH